MAYVNIDYDDRLLANFHVNWLSPVKIRQMIFAGSRKSLIFNELNATEPIKIYDRGIDAGRRSGRAPQDAWSIIGRATSGARTSSRASRCKRSVRHFAECIREQKLPLSDGSLGLRVVRLLEAATRSLRAQGGRVVLVQRVPWSLQQWVRRLTSERIRPTSSGSRRTSGWAKTSPCTRSLTSTAARSATTPEIGTFVEIQKNAVIGARCKIQSHTFICEGVTIEDEVFVGHGVMFINDLDPRATADGQLQTEADWQVIPTRVCRGASIGSGAVILGGVTIGAGALIGAGAVVTRDVEPGAVVAGVPARLLRWRDQAGVDR